MRALTKTLVTVAAASAMAFALGACGSSDGESSPGGQGGSAGTGGGAAGSSGAGGGSTAGPSCEQLCPVLVACGVSEGDCQATCPSMSGACRSCLQSSGCDPTPCDATCQGGGGSGGGAGAGGGSAGGGGGSSSSDLGKDCTVGGFDSQCASGESCMTNKGGLAGICTIPCTDWSACPSFWDCQQVGPGKFCFPQ